ncbi:MAG: hypothetical protein HC908_17350 [Calothrix sp. SM1_7_51]|nr:hypothetical protein [Calothrix sp. SM1_7_51]
MLILIDILIRKAARLAVAYNQAQKLDGLAKIKNPNRKTTGANILSGCIYHICIPQVYPGIRTDLEK